NNLWSLFWLSLWLGAIFAFFLLLSLRRPVDRLLRLIETLPQTSESSDNNKKPELPQAEPFRKIGERLLEMNRQRLAAEATQREQAVSSRLAEVAKQVSHDIRSPLAALNMFLPAAEEIAEEQRLVVRNAIQRIQDIANDLLHKSQSAVSSDNKLPLAPQL